MINPKMIKVTLIVIASVLIGITMPSQYVTASFCTNMLSEDADVDTAEDVAAGNATMMMTNQTAGGNMSEIEFLSIQAAQSSSLSQINATAYTLELKNVSDSTIMFSDRPNRIVESVSTADFVGNWTNGPNNFAADPPNAALVVENNQTGRLDTTVVDLASPVYDTTVNTLTYTIMIENGTSVELASEFGQSILVVDAINDVSRARFETNTELYRTPTA
jgi:hypothetical protein